MDDCIEAECDEEIARYSLENQKLKGGNEHQPRPMSWDGQLTDTEVENDVSVQVLIKEEEDEIEDVEFSSPSPKATSAFSNNTSNMHHNQSAGNLSSQSSTGASLTNPNVQGQMKPSHSFYVTHSASSSPQQNRAKGGGTKGCTNNSDFDGSSSGSSNNCSIKLSSSGPLGQAANSVLNVNIIQNSQSQQQQRGPSVVMPIQMQQQNAQMCNFPVTNNHGQPPQLPSSLPPTTNNNNNNNFLNNSISLSSCVSTNNNSVSNNSGLSQLQQQPPMNLSFPRIPPSPDSALGGWSTPSSNLSRHNSDASQRSFSSSSNNDIQTPPSPSNSPLLSHNRILNKCDDYDPDQQEVLLSSNFSSQGISRQQLINSPCPICSDRISGFHYGIFSCESCKGFFKRTVQNRKNYVCLRGASCLISISTRKKCPSCRMAKCLQAGMKLEAIREDRTRGGRSTYACSYALPPTSTGTGAPSDSVVLYQPPTWEIPNLLKEIVECESLWHLSEGDSEIDMGKETKTSESADYLTELCHAADRRLYRLVKWCKSLPLFKNIQVDDQTKLLLNSWCELLLFSCCYRSIPMPAGHIRINERLTLKEGDAPGNQCITRMIHFTDNLRRLRLDTVEYAALKVIILMSSDGLEALDEAEKVRESQERLLQCLQASIQSRCPESPSKFGELLLKIPELQRICQVGKEMCLTAKTDESTGFNLLFELLRGDH